MNHLLGWSFLKGSTTTPTSQGGLLPWLKPCTMKSLSMKMVSLMVGHLVCETCCESDFGIVLFGRSILRILICTKLNMFQILCIFFRAMKLCSKLWLRNIRSKKLNTVMFKILFLHQNLPSPKHFITRNP